MHIRTILLYAQDSRGLGHITRSLTVARRVLARYPDLVAYIATKSPIAENFALPERCDYIKLPTRLTPDTIQQTPLEEDAAIRRFRKIRGQLLRDAGLYQFDQLGIGHGFGSTFGRGMTRGETEPVRSSY